MNLSVVRQRSKKYACFVQGTTGLFQNGHTEEYRFVRDHPAPGFGFVHRARSTKVEVDPQVKRTDGGGRGSGSY
jgi:hypothetical protein